MLAGEDRTKSLFLPLSATKARSVLFIYIVSGAWVLTDLLVSICVLWLKCKVRSAYVCLVSPPESSISCFCRQLSAVIYTPPLTRHLSRSADSRHVGIVTAVEAAGSRPPSWINPDFTLKVGLCSVHL